MINLTLVNTYDIHPASAICNLALVHIPAGGIYNSTLLRRGDFEERVAVAVAVRGLDLHEDERPVRRDGYDINLAVPRPVVPRLNGVPLRQQVLRRPVLANLTLLMCVHTARTLSLIKVKIK